MRPVLQVIVLWYVVPQDIDASPKLEAIFPLLYAETCFNNTWISCQAGFSTALLLQAWNARTVFTVGCKQSGLKPLW